MNCQVKSEMAANEQQRKEQREPPHHARRPMNAFLIFCKRHRGSVRSGFPHLENRAVTRILGEWWATLQPDQKRSYTNLAQEYKNAFLSANPDFKWYKLPAPPLRTLNTRPTNKKVETNISIQPLGSMKSEYESSHNVNLAIKDNQAIQPGKLADETQIGGLSSLFTPQKLQLSKERLIANDSTVSVRDTNVPKPPKKRYMDQTPSNEYKLDCKVNLFNEKQLRRIESNNNNKQPLQNTNSNEDRMSSLLESNNSTEGNTFRTERTCKGLRYQKFLAEQMRCSGSVAQRNKPKRITEYYGCDEHTIERRNSISSNISEKTDSISSEGGNSIRSELEHLVESAEGNMEASKPEETETGMTGIEVKANFRPWAIRKRFRAEDFNLEKKIEALPSLSLEEFQEKKKLQRNKKKKITQKVSVTSPNKKYQCSTGSVSNTLNHKKAQCSANRPLEEDDNKTHLVGSQKRKARKRSITRNTGASRQDESNEAWCATPDLEALACLAAVAANRTKLTKNNS